MSNDHFVSQFYLRNFSPDGPEGGRVRAINLGRGKYIPTASIAGQCQRAGFYGGDANLDRMLGTVEGHAANAILRIIESNRPPDRQDHFTLAVFAAIQRSRTKKAADDADRMAERMREIAYEGGKEGCNESVRRQLDGDFTIAMQMRVVAECAPAAAELTSHLLVNDTGEEFITSDHPAFAHNQWCEGVDYSGVTGWNCAGVQLFLPISPRHVLFFYDAKRYAVGEKRDTRASRVGSVADVRTLNSFQILNANANIYFGAASMAELLLQQVRRLASLRTVKRHKTVQTHAEKVGENTSEIIHQYEALIPLKLMISTIRIKRSMRRVPLRSRIHMVRIKRDLESPYPEPEMAPVYRARRSFAD